MSAADSQPEPAPPSQEAPPEPQEQQGQDRTTDARVNGIMSTLGKRTQERDDARQLAERSQQQLQALREELDRAYGLDYQEEAGQAASDDQAGLGRGVRPGEGPEPEPEPQERLYTEAEARQLFDRSGHVDGNNASRANSIPARPATESLADLRRELDSTWSQHQRELIERELGG